MKNIALNILKWKLKHLARMTISKYRPGIIGITGSVGKTSTKEAIYSVLKNERTIRKSASNNNNELGLCLTILSPKEKITQPSIIFWLLIIIRALWNILVKSKNYPSMLVLEYGADRPGDIERLLAIAKPTIGIATAVGEIPVHVEFFAGPEAVAEEKSKLVRSLPKNGFAILNCDDVSVLEMRHQLKSPVITFGLSSGADVRITHFEHLLNYGDPVGSSFKLAYGGSNISVRLIRTFGKAQSYAVAAAASVGLILGMNLVKISEALGEYRAPSGRMRLYKGVRADYVLDDTYNASPSSMHAALDTMRDLPGKRKIAILGDMLEIGKYSLDAHEEIGRLVKLSCDYLVTVGPRAKFIAQGAIREGFNKKNIRSFEIVEDALKIVHDMMQAGDLVLVKGSRAIHLERVVDEIKSPIE